MIFLYCLGIFFEVLGLDWVWDRFCYVDIPPNYKSVVYDNYNKNAHTPKYNNYNSLALTKSNYP